MQAKTPPMAAAGLLGPDLVPIASSNGSKKYRGGKLQAEPNLVKERLFSCAQFALYGRQTCRMDADCGGRVCYIWCKEFRLQLSIHYVTNQFNKITP